MFKRKAKKDPVKVQPVHFHRPAKPTSIKHIIAVASGKGGVGKSTVTAQLAMGLAEVGFKVGLIDADIYGPSQPGMFAVRAEQAHISDDGKIQPVSAHGVKLISASMLLQEDAPIIWRAPMATKLVRDFLSRVDWQTDLDYLLIDLPPGTGDIQITLAQQAKLTGAIIVTTPQQVAFKIAEKAIQMFEKVHIPLIGLIENMSGYVCEHCHHETPIFQQGGAQQLAKKYKTNVLAEIPLDKSVVHAGDAGASLLATGSAAAHAYQALIDALPARCATIAVNAKEPVKIDKQAAHLLLAWADKTQKQVSAYQLRLACPCALCVDEITGEKLLKSQSISTDIQLGSIGRVGHYALKLHFSDGHNTGIFTFDKLKQFPNCETPLPEAQPITAEPLAEKAVRAVLDKQLNPQVAQHGGKVELVRVEGQRVFVRLAGGCQGCSQANVTLKQGVLQLLKQHFPSLETVVDVTEHALGDNPYY